MRRVGDCYACGRLQIIRKKIKVLTIPPRVVQAPLRAISLQPRCFASLALTAKGLGPLALTGLQSKHLAVQVHSPQPLGLM